MFQYSIFQQKKSVFLLLFFFYCLKLLKTPKKYLFSTLVSSDLFEDHKQIEFCFSIPFSFFFASIAKDKFSFIPKKKSVFYWKQERERERQRETERELSFRTFSHHSKLIISYSGICEVVKPSLSSN